MVGRPKRVRWFSNSDQLLREPPPPEFWYTLMAVPTRNSHSRPWCARSRADSSPSNCFIVPMTALARACLPPVCTSPGGLPARPALVLLGLQRLPLCALSCWRAKRQRAPAIASGIPVLAQPDTDISLPQPALLAQAAREVKRLCSS